jgi:cyclic beta-1,2-glucan synthetase
VITLDSDTQLPMEAARRLVGTLAHPLNRPRFDPCGGGSPKGTACCSRRRRGPGQREPHGVRQVFSGHVGVDPYTTAVSDVYQDLFHEGSYVGKGIYDVDAFDAALADRVPENTLLSHDLFEGFYARAGLCTDSHLVDDYPADYLAFAARQHRWVRGDWQIVRWLWRTVPNAERRPVRNTLGAIARWKILDNLRRSLLAPALMLLLVLGWTVLPGSPLLWTGLAALVLAFPAYTQVGRSLGSRVRGVPLRQHVAAERDNIAHERTTGAALVHVPRASGLADARCHREDAVAPARQPPAPARVGHGGPLCPCGADATVVFRRMWVAPVPAWRWRALVAVVAPARLPLALPLCVLWMISPAIALVTGRPIALRAAAARAPSGWRCAPSPGARGDTSRTCSTPADHWLIPDNYQEDRKEAVAHRTSPTNIGLQLLSTVSAYHFGYLSFSAVLDRLEPTFATLRELPRYRGHFYNWYDTQTLAPLVPRYVSTVDSGNLAGYLLTLNGALLSGVHEAPVIDARALDGVEDASGCSRRAWRHRRPRAVLAGRLEERTRGTSGAAEGRARLIRLVAHAPGQIGDRVATLGLLLTRRGRRRAASDDAAWISRGAPVARAGLRGDRATPRQPVCARALDDGGAAGGVRARRRELGLVPYAPGADNAPRRSTASQGRGVRAALDRSRRTRRRSSTARCGSRNRPTTWPGRWTSPFCSIGSGSSSRSGSASRRPDRRLVLRHASRPRRGWPVSSPSRPGRSRTTTGSSSGAR